VESRKFTRQPEDFDCLHCGAGVRGNGYTNHCPRCLWSRHVDVRPGDRESDCGGAMEPVGALYEGGRTVVVQRCRRCGHTWRNKTARNDSRAAVLALFGRVVEDGRC
jgi:rubrerythrin